MGMVFEAQRLMDRLNFTASRRPGASSYQPCWPLMCSAMPSPEPAAGDEPSPSRAAVIQALVERVDRYVALRKKLEQGLPPLQTTKDTMRTADRQNTLAQRVREARSSARPGERRASQKEVPAVPPLLLKQLPRLPDDVEYRFMDRDLILRDARANVIVDVLTSVLPNRGR
jgi:hypothetical protein